MESQAAHAFTVALLETFYEGDGKRVSDGDVTSILKEADIANNYDDVDDFVTAYEEHIWTEENEMKFGGVHCDDDGYFLRDPEDDEV